MISNLVVGVFKLVSDGIGVFRNITLSIRLDAQLHFIDESYMAVASAQLNFERAFPARKANYTATDALRDFSPESVDLVLCNPLALRIINFAFKAISATFGKYFFRLV
jgi:hypothetical protein